MRMLTRGWGVLAGVAATAAIAAAGVAYACTPVAHIDPDKRSYLPGETVTVTGRLFDPQSPRGAEVHFGDDEALVGRAVIDGDGNWSLSFPLPSDIRPGNYLVYAEARDANDQVVRFTRASLTVRGPAPAKGGGDGSTGQRRNGPSESPGDPASNGSNGTGRASGGARDHTVPTLSAGSDVADGRPAAGERQGASHLEGERSARSAPPSERSTIGDLWSGFGPGSDAARAPGAPDAATPAGAAGSRLAVGIALLGLGLVTLLGGAAIAEARRRRRPAQPHGRQPN